jgi:hypothetical protein
MAATDTAAKAGINRALGIERIDVQVAAGDVNSRHGISCGLMIGT